MKNHLSIILLFCFFSLVGRAQSDSTNVKITNNNIEITATNDVNITTGSGKAYYNGKKVATDDEIRASATLVVAASNASEKSKAGADYVCTGTNDEVTILAAMGALVSTGGKIQLTEGMFNIYECIIDLNNPVSNLTISGMGTSTILRKIVDGGEVVLFPRGSNVVVENLMIDCNNFFVDGLKISNTGTVRAIARNVKVVNINSKRYGIWIQNNYSLILDCFVDGGAFGIYIGSGQKNCIIQGNIVINATISIRANGTNILVTNNLVSTPVVGLSGNEKIVNNYTIIP